MAICNSKRKYRYDGGFCQGAKPLFTDLSIAFETFIPQAVLPADLEHKSCADRPFKTKEDPKPWPLRRMH